MVTATETTELQISTTLTREGDTATRTFNFPSAGGELTPTVLAIGSDLAGSLLGGYSTVFQPTSWRDEDVAEDEYSITSVKVELVNKTTTTIEPLQIPDGYGIYVVPAEDTSTQSVTVAANSTLAVDYSIWNEEGTDTVAVGPEYGDGLLLFGGASGYSVQGSASVSEEAGGRVATVHVGSEDATIRAQFFVGNKVITSALENSLAVTIE